MAIAPIKEAWLCLRFTHLGLNSLAVRLDTSDAIVVTYQQKVWQCSNAAKQYGLQQGMTASHALQLNPELKLIERDLKKEAQKLQDLSYWAYQFTSLVSQKNDHSLLLEIGRSATLFKDLNKLINLIKQELLGFNIEAQLGLAQTSEAAYVLSFDRVQEYSLHSAKTCLARAAIAHLGLDSQTIEQLQSCGFKQLADIQAISQTELGARFGVDCLSYLNKLWGHVADPQTGITPPETFYACADFAEPISNLQWIEQQLECLLKELIRFIHLRQQRCRRFSWRFYHQNKQLECVTISINGQQNNAQQTFETFKNLTTLKLESLKLKWEFSKIELTAKQLTPRQLFNDDLFDPSPNQAQFEQLVDKLSSRLGSDALFRVHPEDEHLPELANGQYSVQETSQKYSPFASKERPLKDQPLWLLENPQKLKKKNQQLSQPWHEGPLSIIHGPDRITSHWWAKTQSRDYFIARQRSGRLLWIFFDRGKRDWFLHGLFS